MLILDDPLLQKYIALRPNGDARRLRLERQLEVFLDEQLENIDSSLNTSNELSDILGRLFSYIRYSKVNTKFEILEARLICSDNTKARKNLLRTLSTEVEWTRQSRRDSPYTITCRHSAFRRCVHTSFLSLFPVFYLHLYCTH